MNILNVFAIDNNSKAISCIKKNIEKNNLKNQVNIIESNLFEKFSENIKFDLIVFNHPYENTKNPIVGKTGEGGKTLIERFFKEVKKYSHINTKIIMPFSDYVGKKNDPLYIANEFNFKVKILKKVFSDGINHFVYEISIS